jgi:hypothetical protein
MIKVFRAALAASALVVSQTALSQDAPPARGGIVVELNKLEPAGPACRGYFIVTNGTPDGVKDLRLAVYLFDKNGIVIRSVALTFSDIRADRSKVVLFDIPDTACGDVGRLAVNDVLSCTGANGQAIANCQNLVSTRTRAAVDFAY